MNYIIFDGDNFNIHEGTCNLEYAKSWAIEVIESVLEDEPFSECLDEDDIKTIIKCLEDGVNIWDKLPEADKEIDSIFNDSIENILDDYFRNFTIEGYKEYHGELPYFIYSTSLNDDEIESLIEQLKEEDEIGSDNEVLEYIEDRIEYTLIEILRL